MSLAWGMVVNCHCCSRIVARWVIGWDSSIIGDGVLPKLDMRSQLPAITRGIILLLAIVGFWFWNGDFVWAQPARDLSRQEIQQVTLLRRQAFEASRLGNFQEAEQLWSELLIYLPNEAAIWSNRGNVRVSLNRLEEAIDDYNQAIALAPFEADPYLNRGAAMEGLERWQEAIDSYDRVLSLDPEDAAAFNNRGNAKAGLRDWEAALADYQRAIEINPNFALARVNAALVFFQTGDRQEAIRRFRNLTRKYPAFADPRAALTAALWETGQRGEAESNWVAVVGLDNRYKDLDWLAKVRRWPPEMVKAMEKFLNL